MYFVYTLRNKVLQLQITIKLCNILINILLNDKKNQFPK